MPFGLRRLTSLNRAGSKDDSRSQSPDLGALQGGYNSSTSSVSSPKNSNKKELKNRLKNRAKSPLAPPEYSASQNNSSNSNSNNLLMNSSNNSNSNSNNTSNVPPSLLIYNKTVLTSNSQPLQTHIHHLQQSQHPSLASHMAAQQQFEPQYQNQVELSRTKQESVERTNSGPKRVHYAPHTQFAKQEEHDNEVRTDSLQQQQQQQNFQHLQQQQQQQQQTQQQLQRHAQNIPTSASIQSLTNKNARLQRQSSTNAGTPTQGKQQQQQQQQRQNFLTLRARTKSQPPATTPISAGQSITVRNSNFALPKGGEEVLIGSRASRTKDTTSISTGSVPRSSSASRNLHTSSSIDVVITETPAESRSKSHDNNKNMSRSSKSKSKIDGQNSQNQQTNRSSNGSNPTIGTSSSVSSGIGQVLSQQQQQNSGTTSSQLTGSQQRSASTTPMDRNFYAFQASNYHHPPASALFDEDPGIMSEIETSATGFRRGGKIRSSLPVVRTPSKSQDQSLGLVFLQFRNETKRALLPNEITSLDTVKALFVRSFPRQLSMNYLEHPSVRVYIHDAGKDMFYELEDLRDVKDRAILRIYEKGVVGPQPGEGASVSQLNAIPLGLDSIGAGLGTGGDNFGYFSEPEFDSDFQSQHIHRKRPFPLPVSATGGAFPHPVSGAGASGTAAGPQSSYYGTIMVPPQFRHQLGLRPGFPVPVAGTGSGPPVPPARGKAFPGYSQTLPRGTHLMSPTSTLGANGPMNHFAIASQQQPPPKPQRSFIGQNPAGIYLIQRPIGSGPPPPGSMPAPVPSPGPPQPYGAAGQRPLPDRPYSVTGNYPSPDRLGRTALGHNTAAIAGSGYPQHDISGYLSSPEHRSNSGLLTNIPQQRASFSAYPTGPRFEDVAFQPINLYANRLGQGPPPPLPPSHSGTVESFRMQEMERQIASLTNAVNKALTTGPPQSKPLPPPKPASLMPGYRSDHVPLTSDDCLKTIKIQTSELKNELKILKKTTQLHKSKTQELMEDNLKRIKDSLSFITNTSDSTLRIERCKVSHDRDSYTDDLTKLDKDLAELESQVEELRSNVINRRCRVNVSNVESMAHVLARASKTVSDLKSRYPSLAKDMKNIMSRELQHIEREEKFLKEEPDRLEHSLRRCKKLTGTLVTLKRLASVQEQRSSSNPSTCSPSQLRDGSGDELSSSVPRSSHDPLIKADKKRADWRRSVHFHRPLTNKHKIDLCRGFTSMPTIQDDVDVDMMGGRQQQQQQSQQQQINSQSFQCKQISITQRSTSVDHPTKGTPIISNYRNRLGRSKSNANELMEPHTVIQVTPATPSSTDSSKTATILENLFDELQSFSKQSSIDSTIPPMQRSTGSLRHRHHHHQNLPSSTDPLRKASRSKSYSSLRANSESPNPRNRGSSLADGTIDLESIAVLASKCGQSAAATAALMEKHFAQSRQELLEQRHQELLRKQRQLQEQYTRLQQLSRGQMNRQIGGELKKTGSESNLRMMDATVGVSLNVSSKSNKISSSSVHGSLKNLSKTDSNSTRISTQSAHHRVGDSNPEPIPKKVYETDIL